MFLTIRIADKDKTEIILNVSQIASLIPSTRTIVMCGKIKPFTVDKRNFAKVVKATESFHGNAH